MNYNSFYLSLHNKNVISFISQNNTMDSTLIPDTKYLFAECITDGALDGMSEKRRTEIIQCITNYIDDLLKDYQPADSDPKSIKKYQNNEDGQNNGKVSK